MVEKTSKQQQQQLIEKQVEEMRAMKQRIDKLRTVNLETQDDLTETIHELEERNEEAERRNQDLEMKVWHLGNAKTIKNQSCPTDTSG